MGVENIPIDSDLIQNLRNTYNKHRVVCETEEDMTGLRNTKRGQVSHMTDKEIVERLIKEEIENIADSTKNMIEYYEQQASKVSNLMKKRLS